jgi:hypothetical protein
MLIYFWDRTLNTSAFKYVAYALSGVALSIAAIESYSVISNSDILPPLTGPILAVIIFLSHLAMLL